MNRDARKALARKAYKAKILDQQRQEARVNHRRALRTHYRVAGVDEIDDAIPHDEAARSDPATRWEHRGAMGVPMSGDGLLALSQRLLEEAGGYGSARAAWALTDLAACAATLGGMDRHLPTLRALRERVGAPVARYRRAVLDDGPYLLYRGSPHDGWALRASWSPSPSVARTYARGRPTGVVVAEGTVWRATVPADAVLVILHSGVKGYPPEYVLDPQRLDPATIEAVPREDLPAALPGLGADVRWDLATEHDAGVSRYDVERAAERKPRQVVPPGLQRVARLRPQP